MSSLRLEPRLARQKERRAKEAGERAASEAERAEAPRAQLRENIEYVRWPGCGLQLRRRAVRPGLK